MFLATRLATRRAPAAIAAALTVGLCAAPALAQTQAPAQQRPNRPAQPAAPAPQQPLAPGQPAPGGQAAGPQVIAVKPEPSQTDWTKVCGKDQNSSTEICYTTRDFIPEQGQPIFAVAVYDVKGPQQTQKVIRFLMPLGLLLKPGIRFTVDQGQPTPGSYAVCFPNGCFAESPVKDDVVNTLKKGTTLNVSVQNQVAREVTVQIPLAGFGKAFDGPPIDPKVLQEQQKKLQEELEKRSDELRKRLESNAAGAAAPAAVGTPPVPGAPAAGSPQRP
jgi:invasion protein IalB